jgi:hypothetical protein
LIQVLKDSLRFFKFNFVQIMSIYIPIFIIQYILGIFFNFIPSETLSRSVSLLIGSWISAVFFGALTLQFNGVLSGYKLAPKECLLKGLLISPLVFYIDVIVGAVTLIGLLVLIIPGFILGARLSLSPFIFLLSNSKPIEAIKKSFHMTKGFTKIILGSILTLGVPIFAIVFILRLLIATQNWEFLLEFEIGFLLDFLSIMCVIILFRIYSLINEQSPEA